MTRKTAINSTMKQQTKKPSQTPAEIRKIRRYAWIFALLWTLLLSGLFVTYVVDNRETIREIGYSMALASFEKDVLFRRWGAQHGGVYVPETTRTPANSYLSHIPERDITTPSGKRLTLVNPAYMSRQIFELAREQLNLPQGHITSLNPIRPENAPDAWETMALKSMEQGAKEVVESVQLNGQPHLRLMRPLVTEKPCLKCHAAQGYKEGDGRGGISVTLSLLPIQETMNKEMLQEAFIHSFIWLLGLGFIFYGTKKITHITKSLRNEHNALLESSERYRYFYNNTPVMLHSIDENGNLISVSEYWLSTLGYTRDEVLGRKSTDFLTEASRKYAIETVLPEFRKTGNCHNIEYQYVKKNGEVINSLLSAISERDENGILLRALAVVTDITNRKRAEEERKLLEQQFQHAQKMESLGVLAGGIAHDFNNILTVIMGHCYMAKEDFIPAHEYKKVFQNIEAAGNRASDLCRQMLMYAGKSPMEQTRLNLWLLVNEVVKILQAGISKSITLELDLNQRIPEIMGDTGQIQQVVMNLIINAAEAIGDATGAIRVVLRKMNIEADSTETDAFDTVIRAGSYVCLEVTDNGCGMDETTKNRIFEPFFTTKVTGRGLGMSAIRGIIKSHNGVLQLTSDTSVGTAFKVYFPVITVSGDPEIKQTELPPAAMASGTILLVEDEQTLLNLGNVLLSAFGFSVMTASNGSEALAIYREYGRQIDLILMDLIMPVMGGVETYHELRAINPTIPIIICSGYGVESVEEVINNDQFAGFVHKPYKPVELQDILVKMMGSSIK